MPTTRRSAKLAEYVCLYACGAEVRGGGELEHNVRRPAPPPPFTPHTYACCSVSVHSAGVCVCVGGGGGPVSDELVAKIESHSLYTHLRYYVSSKAQKQASNSVEYQQAMHALAALVDDAGYDAKAGSRAREVGKVLFVSDKHGDDDDNESSNNDSGGEGASQAASVKGSLGTGTSLGMAKSSGKRKRGKAKKTRKSKSKAKAETKTRTKFRPAKRSKTGSGKAKARKLASRSSSSSWSSSSSCVTLSSCSSTSSSSVSTSGSDDVAGLKAEARSRKAERGKTVPQADAAVAYMAKLGIEGDFDPKRARNIAYARAYLKVKLGQVEPHPSPLAPKVGKKGVNYKSSEVCMFFALGALCFIGCGKFKKAFLKKMYEGAVSPRFVWERPPPESGGLRKLLRRMYGAHKEWVDAELGHAFVSWLLTDQSREASKSKTSTATCVEQPMETSGSDNEA